MINANELRIGNQVYYQWGILEKEIRIHALVAIYDNAFNSHFGIPITAEVLKKCGYRMYKDSTGPPINDFVEVWENKDSPVELILDIDNCIIINNYHVNINRPKYLHQLQNLYFALTGEELNYQP